jgi:uncharacterized protein (DUF934 family)
MPTLIDRNGVREDHWSWFDPASTVIATGAPADTGARLLLSLEQWQSHGEALLAAGAVVGICLEADQGPEQVADILGRIGLVAVRFGAFTDGRGYSTARLLRQRYGWTGELRAVGDVLRDQMFYLARCGFDTFDLKDGESVADALSGFGDFTEAYQAAVDRGPLFRRRHEAAEASAR